MNAKLIIDSRHEPPRTEKHLDELGVYIHRVPERWHYVARVEDSRGKTVWSDNGNARTIERLLEQGFRVVTAVRVLEAIGHTLATWRAVVERAAAEEDW